MVAIETPPVYVSNIPDIEVSLSKPHQTGFIGNASQTEAFLNLKPAYAGLIYQQEVQHLQTQLAQERERRYQKLLVIFQQRFEADRDIFVNIEEQKIIATFDQMAELLLHFFPVKISADVTGDASILLQAHFGDVRFYWETYLSEEEPEPYSTLNIFVKKELRYTASDYFQKIYQQTLNIILSLFKQKYQINL